MNKPLRVCGALFLADEDGKMWVDDHTRIVVSGITWPEASAGDTSKKKKSDDDNERKADADPSA